MRNLQKIIALLQLPIQDKELENMQIAKGKYKYPKSIRGMYKVQKRHLKFRNNGGNKNG